MAVSPYSTVNLRTGRMLTTLPVVGWEGRGPSISFSLYHNMTSTLGVLPLEEGQFAGLMMGDANFDGEENEEDISPFIDIILSESPTAEEVAVADFTGDTVADTEDLDGFLSRISLPESGPIWTHSYCMFIKVNSASKLTLFRDDGTQDIFQAPTNSDEFISPPGVYETITREWNGEAVSGYMLRSKNQWKTHFLPESDDDGAWGYLDWIADATTGLDENDLPLNRVNCIYSDGSHGPSGKLWKVVDAAGRVLELTYNANGELSTITDPIDRTWTLLYLDPENPEDPPIVDGDGNFIALQDPNTNHPPITWSYTTDSEIHWIADKNEQPWFFTYDEGRLTDVQDPLGLQQGFSYVGYTDGHTLSSYHDRRNHTWEYWFSSNQTVGTHAYFMGNLVGVKNPLHEMMKFEYEDLRNPSSTAPSGMGYTSNWYLPHRHEATARINALEKTWAYAYEPLGATYLGDTNLAESWLRMGNLATVTDPLEHTWSLEYDDYNNLIQVSQPDEGGDIITQINYDSSIDPTVPTSATLPPDVNDVQGEITLNYWGEENNGWARGQLKNVTDPNNAPTSLTYDYLGQLESRNEGPVGPWHRYKEYHHYDAVGRKIQSAYANLPDDFIFCPPTTVDPDCLHLMGDPPGEGDPRVCLLGECMTYDESGNPTGTNCSTCVVVFAAGNHFGYWTGGNSCSGSQFQSVESFEEEPAPRVISCGGLSLHRRVGRLVHDGPRQHG